MKKNLFWKICAVMFLVLLAAWVWFHSVIVIIPEGPYGRVFNLIKVNKLNGFVYTLSISVGDIEKEGWRKRGVEYQEQAKTQ